MIFVISFFLGLLVQGQNAQPSQQGQQTNQQPGNPPAQTGSSTAAGSTTGGTPAPPRPSNTDPFNDPGASRKRALLVPWESALSRAEFAKKQNLGRLGRYLTYEVVLVGIYEKNGELQAGFRTQDSSGLIFATVGNRFFNGRIIRIANEKDPKDRKVIVEGRLQPNGKVERIEISLRKANQ